MGRFVMGGIALCLTSLLASSMAVEAQVPEDGWTPSLIGEGAVQATFEGDVTCSGSFYYRLKVDYNGSTEHNNVTYVSTGGGTINVSQLVEDIDTWGIEAGNHLDCKVTAWYWSEWWGNSREWDCDIEAS